MIHLNCSKCQEPLEAPESLANKLLECPKCHHNNIVSLPPTTRSRLGIWNRSVSFRIIIWLVVPIISLGLLTKIKEEHQQVIRAQERVAERLTGVVKQPLKVEVERIHTTPFDSYVTFVFFLVLLGILISCWQQDLLLRKLLQQNNASAKT